MIKDFLVKNYCPKNCNELFQRECCEGVRTRCSDFEEREKLLEDFAEQENNRLKKQIVALEAKNIELSENWKADHDTLVFYDDKLEKQAKKIVEELHEIVANKVEYKSTIPMWNTMARAEQFLQEIEK